MSSRNSFSRLTWWVSPAGYPLVGHPADLGSGQAPRADPQRSVSLRFRKQRKAVVSANDKKMPNGILEEQGKGGPRRGWAEACLPRSLTFQ